MKHWRPYALSLSLIIVLVMLITKLQTSHDKQWFAVLLIAGAVIGFVHLAKLEKYSSEDEDDNKS